MLFAFLFLYKLQLYQKLNKVKTNEKKKYNWHDCVELMFVDAWIFFFFKFKSTVLIFHFVCLLFFLSLQFSTYSVVTIIQSLPVHIFYSFIRDQKIYLNNIFKFVFLFCFCILYKFYILNLGIRFDRWRWRWVNVRFVQVSIICYGSMNEFILGLWIKTKKKIKIKINQVDRDKQIKWNLHRYWGTDCVAYAIFEQLCKCQLSFPIVIVALKCIML